MWSPKEQHQKKNRTNDVCASKNTLKTPLGPFLKKGGGFQNPARYRISQKPPPPGQDLHRRWMERGGLLAAMALLKGIMLTIKLTFSELLGMVKSLPLGQSPSSATSCKGRWPFKVDTITVA